MITKKRIWGMPPMLNIICDDCEVQLLPVMTLGEARERMKKEKWVCRKVDGEWLDLCPACASAERKKSEDEER